MFHPPQRLFLCLWIHNYFGPRPLSLLAKRENFPAACLIQLLSQGFVAFWQRQSADSLKLPKHCWNLSPLSNRIKKHGGSRLSFFFSSLLHFPSMQPCARGRLLPAAGAGRCSYSLSSYLMAEDKWWLLCLQRPLCYCQWTVIIHWPGHHLAKEKKKPRYSHLQMYSAVPSYHSSLICHLLVPHIQIRLTLA